MNKCCKVSKKNKPQESTTFFTNLFCNFGNVAIRYAPFSTLQRVWLAVLSFNNHGLILVILSLHDAGFKRTLTQIPVNTQTLTIPHLETVARIISVLREKFKTFGDGGWGYCTRLPPPPHQVRTPTCMFEATEKKTRQHQVIHVECSTTS